MTYKAARAAALNAGFQTPALPPYGYRTQSEAAKGGCNEEPNLCNRYPEIDACSGQGHCVMNMTDAYGNRLRIVTYGHRSIEDLGAVTSFEVTCTAGGRAR
jgi:hypothetical protein